MEQAATVSLEELAGQLGGSYQAAEYWLSREGVKTGRDWADRPAIPAEQAAKVVSSFRRAMESQAAKLASFDAYLADRERRRREVGEKAFEKAVIEGTNQERKAMLESTNTIYTSLPVIPSGAVYRRAQEAMAQAQEAFDRKDPRPNLEAWARKHR